MRLYKTALLVAVLFAVTLSIPVYGTEGDPAKPEVANKPPNAKYPFIAEVTGNDVYVRSGKGKAYYHCRKVQQGFQVTVAGEVFGWAKIIPPEGSYSWINKKYVDVADGAPTIGTINGDNIRVWAGSDYMGPTRSSSMQVKINDGEQVQLFPSQPETGDYYKIKPPTGAYLWISADFLKYAAQGDVEEAPDAAPAPSVPAEPTKPVQPVVKPVVKEPLPPATESSTPTFQNLTDTPPVKPAEPAAAEAPKPAEPAVEKPVVKVDKDSQALAACYEIGAKIDEELKKPLNEQDYSGYKKTLTKIAAGKETSKASTYAKILLERIQRYELAISVTDILKQQDKDLAETKERIQKAHKTQLKKIPAKAKYMFTGTLKQSHVYTEKTGRKRYMLLDANGKIQCYLIAASPAAESSMSQMLNTKVGINGASAAGVKSSVPLIAVNLVEAVK
ncbi:MAG: SH3 domain-containing protein [Planctomycetota bacterium]